MLNSMLSLQIDEINNSLSRTGYHIISNSSLKELAVKARDEYINSMSVCEASPPKMRFSHLDLRNKPHRKYTIGSTNGIGESYAQLLQTTYFSKDDPGYQALGAAFAFLISLRNNILGVDLDFGNNPDRDGFWNACRIHHYPRGGAFMVGHKDTYFPSLLEKAGHPFLQVMLILSTRGVDFYQGGGYIVDRGDNVIYYEDPSSLGNIVCFDGSIVHGVSDVDGDQIFDFNKTSGRIAAFVNLYKVL